MLVLARKPGEKIRIGEDIVITVAKVNASRVKLAITAPGMDVVRMELETKETTRENK